MCSKYHFRTIMNKKYYQIIITARKRSWDSPAVAGVGHWTHTEQNSTQNSEITGHYVKINSSQSISQSIDNHVCRVS